MRFNMRINRYTRKRNNQQRTKEKKSPSTMISVMLAACKLDEECINEYVINENCLYQNLASYLATNHGDDFIGDENLFELIIPYVNDIMNFQVGHFTMTIIRITETIDRNFIKFREDFKIERFYRLRDDGMEKCYVIISRLKLYWETSSLGNFINGPKKIKLIDGKRTGTFIWVGLKNLTV